MAFLRKSFSESLRDPSLFRTVYIVNLFLCSVCFWNVAGVAVNTLLLIWALVLLLDAFFIRKDFRRIKHGLLLAAFLAAGLITAVLRVDSNFGVNFVMLYHTAVCFYLFYGIHSEPDREKVQTEIDRLLKIVVALSSGLAVIGLLVVMLAPSGRLTIGNYLMGIMDNRFTGVFTNPNLAAFASVMGMVCCHILMKRSKSAVTGKSMVPRWAAIVCFAANALVLLLSDSNSSLVFAVAYACIYLFCRFVQKSAGFSVRKTVVRGTALAVCCVVLAGSSLVLRTACQTAATGFVNTADQIRAGNWNVQAASLPKDGAAGQQTVDSAAPSAPSNAEIGRTEEYELSSGRLDSLKKSMVLFGKFPLMGVGKGNIVPFGDRYMIHGFAFHDLHNGFLTILISDGMVGFVLFMAFLLLFGLRLVRVLFRNRRENLKEFPALIAAFAAYCVFGLFEKAVLFDITFMVVVFWMLMGHTSAVISEYEWQEDTVDSSPVPALQPAGLSYRGYGYLFSDVQEKAVSGMERLKEVRYPHAVSLKQLHDRKGLSPPHPNREFWKSNSILLPECFFFP